LIPIPMTSHSGSDRRIGDDYHITDEERHQYFTQGYIQLPDLLTQQEVNDLEPIFDRFISGDIKIPGKDFADMSGPMDRPFSEWELINCLVPRRYYPDWQGNIFERRAASVARQLFQDSEMILDYDQLLAKKPNKENALFSMHQDLQFWPKDTPDFNTVTFSLALNDADDSNGCLRVVPGSQLEPNLRPHRPYALELKKKGLVKGDTREDAHGLMTDLKDGDVVHLLEVRRGGVTCHGERIVHGSGGNRSERWRKTYVVAFRSRQTVEHERRLGFNHSYNADHWDFSNL